MRRAAAAGARGEGGGVSGEEEGDRAGDAIASPLKVAAAAAVGIAVVGFFSGTRDVPPVERARPTRSAPSTEAMPRNADMPAAIRGPNAAMYTGVLDSMRPPPPGQGAEGPPAVRDPAERQRALAARAERRAYDGAPPIIPHAVGDTSPQVCLACHQEGLLLAGMRAPRMSHPVYLGCVQCHVVSRDPRGFEEVPPSPATAFVGAGSTAGQRAWPGAPPTTPHPTWMRSECVSCHGPAGAPGLRTSHPERIGCQQCHAPSAVRDQRATGIARAPWERSAEHAP
jgi:cytochrome c-type protein NapB